MEPDRSLSVDEIQLSEIEFWAQPLEVREGAFATLRAEDPIRFFEEVSLAEIGLPSRGQLLEALNEAMAAGVIARPGADGVADPCTMRA